MKDYKYTKTEIEKMKELSVFIKKIDNHLLNKYDTEKFVALLNEFEIMNKEALNDLVIKFGFKDILDFVDNNHQYSEKDNLKRLDIAAAIGSITGVIQSAQIKYLKQYELEKAK